MPHASSAASDLDLISLLMAISDPRMRSKVGGQAMHRQMVEPLGISCLAVGRHLQRLPEPVLVCPAAKGGRTWAWPCLTLPLRSIAVTRSWADSGAVVGRLGATYAQHAPRENSGASLTRPAPTVSRPAWRSAITSRASKAPFISSFLVKDGQLQQCLLACGGILV